MSGFTMSGLTAYEAINDALFGWYPYLALTVFFLGSLMRFDREQYTWKTGSSQLLRRRQLRWGSNMFHIGILVIFIGHAGGLLTPIWVFEMLDIEPSTKQAMAVTIGGIAGVICFIGISMLAHRRLFDPRIRANSSFGDTAILLILWVQLTLGLSTIFISLQHMDGHEMEKFMFWAQGIITLHPEAASYILDVNPLFKVHILLGLSILLVFPFTRLVHVWSAPVWYLGRRGYQVVRARKPGPVAKPVARNIRSFNPPAE
ncbi:respiratory nitrate reductase subunit gamma [Xanthobacter sp. TB0136]|uniref:respiratory nitrate reductase subunit gamma n=1 Tax=Xanthobacter sp. TB0136 TaxID=3459177 RepID=UPI00403975D8